VTGTSSFGETLQRHRRARGLTQADLAEKAHVSERAISDLERALKRPQRATVRLLAEALGLSPDEAECLEVAARAGLAQRGSTSHPVRHNLPVTLTNFVGREQDILDLRQQLDASRQDPAGPRLVTLTGTGGCGKTRLALELATGLLDSYRDGVCYVDLAPVTDERLVPHTVLAALGASESPRRTPLEALQRSLRNRTLLLVLDNCEHLIQACAELVAALLPATTNLRVLAASREPLRVPGETAWTVAPLTIPDLRQGVAVVDLICSPAVRLFSDRARAVHSGFEVTPDDARSVALICAQLDGLPLAIELAAARVNVLTIAQIVARLADRFALLARGARMAVPRHKTMRACVDWSYTLLSEPERRLLRRLSVFAGGWTLEAAEALFPRGEFVDGTVLDLLAGLVDKSLVQRTEPGQGARYRLLETIRQYPKEHLQSASEEGACQHRLVLWCLALLEQAAPSLQGAEQATWLGRIEAERDNLRAALDWCATDSRASNQLGLPMLDVLGLVWFKRQQQTEGRRWIERILGADRGPLGQVRVRVLNWGAEFATHQGDLQSSDQLAEQALHAAKELGYIAGQAVASSRLGTNADTRGAHDRGVALLEEGLRTALVAGDAYAIYYARHKLSESYRLHQKVDAANRLIEDNLALATQRGDGWGVAEALRQLGLIAEAREEFDRAADLLERSLAKWQAIGAARGPHWALLDLGRVALAHGAVDRARQLIGQSLRLNRDTWNTRQIALCLQALAAVAAVTGQSTRAATLFGAAAALGALVAMPAPGGRTIYARGLAVAQDQLGAEAFARAWAYGRALSLEEALYEAEEVASADGRLRDESAEASYQSAARLDHVGHTAVLTTRLTSRQTEVLRLVAEGKTNRQIAAWLTLSHKTVGRHVENIFARLAVSSRAAATRIAVRDALIGESPSTPSQ
jgi:predicted ATPase/DNA-binding CsgD family transcriptional regulator/DNA-binding XRE family transcriptional regulator